MLFLVGVKFWRYNSTQLFPFNSLIISLRIKFHLLTWNHWPLSTKFSTKIEFFIHFFKKAKSIFKEDITYTEKIRSDKFVFEMGVTSDFFFFWIDASISENGCFAQACFYYCCKLPFKLFWEILFKTSMCTYKNALNDKTPVHLTCIKWVKGICLPFLLILMFIVTCFMTKLSNNIE